MVLVRSGGVTKVLKAYCHTNRKSYTKTVLLPQTKFPLRLENKKLVERDVLMNNKVTAPELYAWQENNLKGDKFILHDGPPYANGVPHMGHAINKILKDTITRYKLLKGCPVNYVPGWDCHGLPIELKALTGGGSDLTPIETRENARRFATDAIENQRAGFCSWGVLGDWKHSYKSYDRSYIKNLHRQFYRLYKKKLIYRDLKPVYWSPSSRTALAEAELEYNSNHKSTAVYIKLKLAHLADSLKLHSKSNIYALIWTTTPWTLPSNQAVCFNPTLSYSIVRNVSNTETYIVASKLVDSVSKQIGCELQVLHTCEGGALLKTTYYHPFASDTTLPFLPADHATDLKGTGLVHTAPAHGPEDFLVALKNKINISCMVDEKGCYTSKAGDELCGKSVLKEGAELVMDLLGNDIVHAEDFVHSYPYDWRTKKPVIIRASKQWFINTEAIKEKAMAALEEVEIFPKMYSDKYRRVLVGQLEKRPYWCISRQRVWGAPIPMYYDGNDNPVISSGTIDDLCKAMDDYGADCWWKQPISNLISNSTLNELNVNAKDLEKGQDILDIWFDSGLSWSSVLEDQVADLYVEGVDQFTGWFQHSLITSVALADRAPYKGLYIHGFAVDENGMKMSKSLGNVVDPKDVSQGSGKRKPYGVDTLRWWVVCHANSVPQSNVSSNVLKASSEEVQKIRNALRFALGGLFDYTPSSFNYNSLLIVDKYLLHLLYNFHNDLMKNYESYEFHKIPIPLINFITNPLSSLYYSAIKDRLYCDSADAPSRQAAQYVLLQLFNVIVKSVSPILPHLAEELYSHLPQKKSDSLLQNFDCDANSSWQNEEVCGFVEDYLLGMKREVNQRHGANVTSLDVQVRVSEGLFTDVQNIQSNIDQVNYELADIFQVSRVRVEQDEQLVGTNYSLVVSESSLYKCDRCRKVLAEVKDVLCHRCSLVVQRIEDNLHAVSN